MRNSLISARYRVDSGPLPTTTRKVTSRRKRPLVSHLILEPGGRRSSRDQRRFRDDATAPYRFQQIILADHAVAVLNEKGEQIERLGFKVDQLCAAPQFAALDVEILRRP